MEKNRNGNNYCCIAYTFYESDYRVRRYAEALVESDDNKVDVIALRDKGQKSVGTLNRVHIFRIQKRDFEERGLLSYFFRILAFFIKGSVILLSRHLRYHYRVIHIHNVPDYLVFMAIIPKILGARIILDIHDILPEFFCQKFAKRPNAFLSRCIFATERLSVKFSDAVIVANDLWKEKITKRAKISQDRCVTMLNYPNLDFFRSFPNNSNRKHLNLIYPGHLSHHHGVDIAIRGVAEVRKQFPNVYLHIFAGSATRGYRKLLENLVHELDLAKNVRFYEPVRVDRLPSVYKHMNLGIVPKRAGVFSSEAFSTKILDFMAAGIPVVASKTKIDEYYFDDSMILFFEPENHEDLARRIIELYRNPQKAKSLVKNAQRFVAHNNWDLKKGIYNDILDSLNRQPHNSGS